MKAQSILLCAFLFLTQTSKAQYTINKLLKHDSINSKLMGFTKNILINNGKIVVSGFEHNNNASYLIQRDNLYFLNDTGKIIFKSQYIFDSITYGGTYLLKSLNTTLDSGYTIVGGSEIPTDTIKKQLFIKYSKDGDVEFVKSILPVLPYYSYNFMSSIQLEDSSYLISGDRKDTFIKLYPTLDKLDKYGNVIWTKQYNINKYALISSICKFHGKILMSGTRAYPHPTKILEYRPFVLSTDTEGNLLNIKYFSDTVLYGGLYFYLTKYSEDKLLFYGEADTIVSSANKCWAGFLGITDSNFNFQWRTYFSLPDNIFQFYKASRILDGNIVAVGAEFDGMTHKTIDHIVKVDSNGNKLWERRYFYPNRVEDHHLYDFAEAPNKDIIAVGSVYGKAFPTYIDSQNCWFLRLDSMGKLSPSDSGFLISPTGIMEIGEDANEVLQLYPNPSTNFVKVAYNIHSDGVLSVYDIGGKRLTTRSIKYADHETELDISSFAKGTYIIELVNKKNKYVGKLMKE